MAQTAVTEEQIEEIARTIGEQPGVVQVWLFGSHATGTAGPDSDVDLLVVYEEEPAAMQAVQRLRKLLFDRATPVDVLVTGRDTLERTRDIAGSLANLVASEGRVVYGRALIKH